MPRKPLDVLITTLMLAALMAACKFAVEVPVPAAATVKSVELGNAIDANNKIGAPTSTFAVNDTIYASVATDGPTTGKLIANWSYQDGQTVYAEDKEVPAGPQVTQFQVSKPDGWPLGKYKLEVSLGGAVVQTREFEVGSAVATPRAQLPADEANETDWFAVEKAMGADCGSGTVTDPPLGDTACYGQLPEHLARFLRNIPDDHPLLTAAEREGMAQAKQSFKAVSGLGQRSDFVAVAQYENSLWFRSFEGPDPDTTVYLVYGPRCDFTWRDPLDPIKRKCLPDDTYLREFKLYRVHKGGPPEDVTHELAPPEPSLTPAENRRYGIYLRPEGNARDADVQMDISRLAYVPVLRWLLRPVQEGDYDPPLMPASDPRAFEDPDWRDHAAHFGFLVWTGKHFELREIVPPSLWPCRTVRPSEHACGAGYDSHADRYLDHTESMDPKRTKP